MEVKDFRDAERVYRRPAQKVNSKSFLGIDPNDVEGNFTQVVDERPRAVVIRAKNIRMKRHLLREWRHIKEKTNLQVFDNLNPEELRRKKLLSIRINEARKLNGTRQACRFGFKNGVFHVNNRPLEVPLSEFLNTQSQDLEYQRETNGENQEA